MKRKILALAAAICLLLCGCGLNPQLRDYGFAREVSPQEQALRLEFVETAVEWLGCNESDGSFKPIIDIYNAHEPLAQSYKVKYTDQWCATFVSAVAIQCDLTDIIPTECGCQRQIGLFQALGCWQEDDSYLPLPGDIIYYCTDDNGVGDCTAWSNHVGIVVGTWGSSIKVIEGNYGSAVRYRYVNANAKTIRGFALPDFDAAV